MKKVERTEITDSSVIARICAIQQQFVREWNRLELIGDPGSDQTHDLPGGGIYGFAHGGAVFYLGRSGAFNAWVEISARRPWAHWHHGWSFCRHELTPEQCRKVEVIGSMDVFNSWLAAASLHCLSI
jgi:hypothetical protein